MPFAILVVAPSWVGDMVMTHTLVQLLKQQRPECVIDLLAPAWSLPLIARMPDVRQGIAMPLGHGQLALSTRYQLGVQLRENGYQQAIVLPNSLKSALVPWFAQIPLRTGWRGEMRYGLLNDRRILQPDKYPHTVQRFAALAFAQDTRFEVSAGSSAAVCFPLTELPSPRLIVDEANRSRLLNHFGLNPLTHPVLALCPGSEFGSAKRWPEKNNAQLATQMVAAGWQVWVFGSEKDRPVTDAIAAQLSAETREACTFLAGRTTLTDAIDVLSCATRVVTNDSGLMHVAAALDIPLVALYGSTPVALASPLSQNATVITHALPCSPCRQRVCPLGHGACLADILPSELEQHLFN